MDDLTMCEKQPNTIEPILLSLGGCIKYPVNKIITISPDSRLSIDNPELQNGMKIVIEKRRDNY